MNKSEAQLVLSEIRKVMGDSILTEDVPLDCTPMTRQLEDGSYEIRIKCRLDRESRKALESILDKNRLLMKEEKGIVVIYRNANPR